MCECVSKRALKVQRSPLMHNSSHLRVSQNKIQQSLLSLYIKSGFSRETEPTEIFFLRDLLLGTGSQAYGSWEVPPSAICKLEEQESQWCNSAYRPENQGSWRYKSWPKGRRWNDTQTMKQKKGANSFFPLFSSGPQQTGQCPPTLGRAIYGKESTTSNANLEKKKKTNANLVLIQLHPHHYTGK